MKTAIKLVLMYCLMQILGGLTAGILSVIYILATQDELNPERITSLALVPSMLLGFIYMALYLKKKQYLKNDGCIYSLTSPVSMLWSLIAGITCIFLLGVLMSHLTFLPDIMEETFDVLESGWGGIICIAILGPILEELLFRGAITKVLLQKYRPTKAILISALAFGIIHVNPIQVVNAFLMGIMLAWLYYRTRSLIPGILLHIFNNSISVYSSLQYPEVDDISQLMGTTAIIICSIICIILLVVACNKLSAIQIPDLNATENTYEL